MPIRILNGNDVRRALSMPVAIDAIADALRELDDNRLVLEGPAPCPISRVAGKHRIALDLLSADPRVIQRAMSTVRTSGLLTSDAHIGVDVDPVSLL